MSGTVIGQSIHITGEVHGEEDLIVLGTVTGKIFLKENLIIEESARLEADIETRSVAVSGQVVGDIVASDRVEIKANGQVEGNIKSPRITIADGALFKGNVDMNR